MTNEQSNEDRRRHPRVAIPMLVQYRIENVEEVLTDYTADISESGALLYTDKVSEPGARVFVHITTRIGEFLEAEGKVVRTFDGKLAIELDKASDAVRSSLAQAVQDALAKAR
jgi:c-di-GMP-binding flagellar brake protein YcgR